VATAKYALLGVWAVFAAFTVYFFRDPNPKVPAEPGVVLSPGHGKVDVVDETTEAEFMGGRCQRISMFLSPLDVHVQNAPVAGRVACVAHKPGKFLSAMRADCGLHNENVLIGLESAETANPKIGVRLIAGVLARRIIPWVKAGDQVERGERISLIQFGSRCDVYLPLTMTIAVKVGDRVKGGESILARTRKA
jgi:phosphatidylserine decarboxylase